MDQEVLRCSSCTEVKCAALFVACRLAKGHHLCKACSSLRNKRYFAANRHVFLAGVSRRALGMPGLTTEQYSGILEKYGNKCVMSHACAEVVPLVLVRVAPGSAELVPVVRRLATRSKWVLPTRAAKYLQLSSLATPAKQLGPAAPPPIPMAGPGPS